MTAVPCGFDARKAHPPRRQNFLANAFLASSYPKGRNDKWADSRSRDNTVSGAKLGRRFCWSAFRSDQDCICISERQLIIDVVVPSGKYLVARLISQPIC